MFQVWYKTQPILFIWPCKLTCMVQPWSCCPSSPAEWKKPHKFQISFCRHIYHTSLPHKLFSFYVTVFTKFNKLNFKFYKEKSISWHFKVINTQTCKCDFFLRNLPYSPAFYFIFYLFTTVTPVRCCMCQLLSKISILMFTPTSCRPWRAVWSWESYWGLDKLR